jgi:NTP pyrophosphatase (non-canonical NTP hydrolase)
MTQENRNIVFFLEYQAAAKATAIYPDRGSNPFYPALGLAGEAGEVANKIKKLMRDPDLDENAIRDAIADELGDVLWYLSALCEEFGLALSDVASRNVEKLSKRAAAGTLRGSGDKR